MASDTRWAVWSGLLLSAMCRYPSAQATQVPGVTVYHPRVQETVDTQYYPVHGRTAADLRDEMRRGGPIEAGSRRFGSYTSTFTYMYTYQRTPAECAARVSIQLRSTFNLPQWNDTAGADTVLRTHWLRFVQNLGVHEDGHRVIMNRNVDLMRYKMEHATSPTCDALGRQIKWIGDDANRQAATDQVAYDARTAHGLTQGVRWPPL